MAIINKGFFNVSEVVYNRQLGNDWPNVSITTTADVQEVESNLYYTNVRVQAYLDEQNIGGIDLSSNTTTDLAEGDNLYYTNTRVQSYLDEQNIGGIDLTSNTTTDLAEGDNLYYTNTRVQSYLDEQNIGGIDLSSNTTTDLAEGDNLYYTNTRVQSYLDELGYEPSANIIANVSASLAIDLSGNTTTDLAEGDNLYYTNARVDSYLSRTDLTFQNLTVGGNLTVQGDVTTLNTATLEVEDKNIVIANGAVNAAAADGAGITVDGAQANLVYDSASDKWQFNKTVQVNGYDVLTKELTDATTEPMGFENQTDSYVYFNEGNRRLYLGTNSEFNVWCKGTKIVKTGAEYIILPNVSGLYYFYLDPAGDLQYKTTYFDWANDAPVAYVYYNSNTNSAPFVADERHGIVLDWATHEYLHRTRGAVIAEGFSASNYSVAQDGSSNSHAQLDIADGTFFDEDLEVRITHSASPTANTWEQILQGPAQIPVFYLNGTEWTIDSPTNYPLKQGTSRVKYNVLSGGSWTTPDVPSDTWYTSSWIIATNNLNYPIIAIMGQTAYNKIGDEEAINFVDLTLSNFPIVEFRPLYKLIWQTDSTYTNEPKAQLAAIYDLRNLASASPSGIPVSDHGVLSGLSDDDHAQYLHIETARTVTASHTFNGTQVFANINVNGSLIANLNLSGNTTTDLAEGDNLYYTNARVQSYLDEQNIGGIDLSSNTTTDLAEGDNLYYTNARVQAYFDDGVTVDNDLTVNGDIITGTGTGGSIVGANLISTNVLIVAQSLQGAVLAAFSTSDLAEGSNLYYTNARVQAYLDDNGISGGGANLAESTTTDLAEGDNLYYTNARVLAHLAVSNVSAQSFIATGAGTPTLSSQTNLILSANADNGGAVVIQSSPLRLRSYTTSNLSALTPSAGDLVYNTDENYLQYYNGSSWSNSGEVSESSNVANLVLSISNFTTTDLSEGNNLYYTNARVDSYINDSITTTDIDEGDNLYYTNLRVQAYLDDNGIAAGGGDLTANTTDDLQEGDNNLYYTNARVAAYLQGTGIADAANLSNTDFLPEGNTNLYFTQQRAIDSFTAGRGIAISEAGIVSAKETAADYNLAHNGYEDYRVSDTLEEALNFDFLSASDISILRSLHITNISDNIAYISGNINFADGTSVIFANCLPVPAGTVLELIDRTQVLHKDDVINLQGFDSSLSPAANLLDTIFTYETVVNDSSYKRSANTTTSNGEFLLIADNSSYSIVESVKLVNISGAVSKANVYVKDTNGDVRAHWIYNVSLPTNSSLEILQAPKRLNSGDKLIVAGNENVAAIVSYRNSDTFTLGAGTTSASVGSNVSFVFNTTIQDGTSIYYSIQDS